MGSETVRWNPNQLVMGAVIHSEQPITNLSFHRNGQYLISTTDNSVILTDSIAGKEKKRIHCKTHGVGCATYTHHDSCIIVSGDRKQHDIRYLCLYDNRYIRSYEGHTSRVSSLAMCPTDDHFLSASDGGGGGVGGGSNQDACATVLMWDLNVSNPVAKLTLPGGAEHVRVAYDDSGLIFGVMTATGPAHSIKLYDARNYGKGPFQDLAPQSVSVPNRNTSPYGSQSYGQASPASAPAASLLESAFRRAYTALNSNHNNNSVFSPLGGMPQQQQQQPLSSSILSQVSRHTASDVIWNDLQFNLDGSQVLINCSVNTPTGGSGAGADMLGGGDLGVNTSAGAVLIFDGFKSDVEPAVILRRKNSASTTTAAVSSVVARGGSSLSGTGSRDKTKAITLGACFSTDSKYVLVGNEENEIHTYEVTGAGDNNEAGTGGNVDNHCHSNNNAITCRHVSTLLGHTSPVRCIAPNPKYDVVASACLSTVLWVHNANSLSSY